MPRPMAEIHVGDVAGEGDSQASVIAYGTGVELKWHQPAGGGAVVSLFFPLQSAEQLGRLLIEASEKAGTLE
jgi:hypothetical protein